MLIKDYLEKFYEDLYLYRHLKSRFLIKNCILKRDFLLIIAYFIFPNEEKEGFLDIKEYRFLIDLL